ncbi:MAG: hypothetical protein ABMA64_22210 [Myxococcota bacterium]
MIALALAACAGEDPAPTLTQVQDEVLTPSCAFSTCHASPGASGLVLDPGASWDALVDAESIDNPGQVFVVPGDSEASYLVHKLRGDDGIVGFQMPAAAPVSADQLQLVIDWIDAGALDD